MGVGLYFVSSNGVHAAAVIAEQRDGSISVGGAVFDQVFTPSISANLGAIQIFTFGFGTGSRNPDTNSCSLSLYDDEAGTLMAPADNGFSGFGCGGDLTFTFHNAEPFLQAGHRYRWEYALTGFQAGVSIYGSLNDTVGGVFNIPPVVNAKFIAYAVVAPPTSLAQSDGVHMVQEGETMNSGDVTLNGLLSSASPDSLELQVELEPSFVAFKNQPNLAAPFADSGSVGRVATSGLPAGSYHWQARAVDALGNSSLWVSPHDPPADLDFAVHDPLSDVVLEDNVTTYGIGTVPNPCFGDGSIFSCAPSPVFNHYLVGAPFTLSKITFDWQNDGSNNCDQVGHYGGIITSSNTAGSILATSTNVIYMGCAPGAGLSSGELDFPAQEIPANFYLSFGAFDGALQGGSGISIKHVVIHSVSPAEPPEDPPAGSSREPVVIVPGIFGSAYKNGQWILQPVFKPYDTLKATLEANGYLEGQTLFDFPYDWEHESIPVIAEDFARKLKQIKTACACSKVDVIAHSMGGLVVRQYIEGMGYAHDIDRLVFLGTPHLGSPLAYLAWEGGTTLFSSELDLIAVLQKAFIRAEAIEAGYTATPANPDLQIYRYIHASSSPVYAFEELLPTYDYLRDVQSKELRSYPSGYPANPFLEGLNASDTLQRFGESGVHVVNIYSEDQSDTLAVLKVRQDKKAFPLWGDGVPLGLEKEVGDDTVPAKSAKAIAAESTVVTTGVHMDLPTTAASEIVKRLTEIADPVVVPPPSPISRYLSIFALSPIDILVTAPDGSKIGKDPASGNEIDQIDGAFYSGPDVPGEYVFIPNPTVGQYTISVQGVATGTYHVLASYGYDGSASATSSEAIFQSNTRPGVLQELVATIQDPLPNGRKPMVSIADRDRHKDDKDNDRDQRAPRDPHERDCYNESNLQDRHEKSSY